MASTTEDKSSIIVNNDATVTSSCLNDPNYAIICVFLQKFGVQLKIEHPDFLQLQKMIENTDEVHNDLKQMLVKLLRKTRKSVQPDKLDSALAKFCYTYSAQDAWEIERFGYKKSSLPVKLRILKEILESQFDKNPNFRTIIGAQNATDLRSQPLGKDKLGNAYWSTFDEQCNLRIYQEHLDEEIWKVVATNRDEMAKLISCLKGNELVLPSLVGVVDEDSSSNSMPPKVDALQNGAITTSENVEQIKKENVPNIKIKLNSTAGDSTVEQVKTENVKKDDSEGAETTVKTDAEADDDGDDDESNMSEIDESSQAASESSATTVGTKSNETQNSKRFSLMASKPPSNKSKLRIPASDSRARINNKLKSQPWSSTNKRALEIDSEGGTPKSKRPTLLSASKKTTLNKFGGNGKRDQEQEDEDGDEYDESDDDEQSDEEQEEEEDEIDNDLDGEDVDDEDLSEISDGDVGDEIQEPTMFVRGEGSGKANKCSNAIQLCDNDNNSHEFEYSDPIEEDIFYVIGEGSGYDCDVGNNEVKTTEASSSESTTTKSTVIDKKPMFFFGQAGCLKLSPMKPSTPPQISITNENDIIKSNDTIAESTVNPEIVNEAISSHPKENSSDIVANTNNLKIDALNLNNPLIPTETNDHNADETDKSLPSASEFESQLLTLPEIESTAATKSSDSNNVLSNDNNQTNQSTLEEKNEEQIAVNDLQLKNSNESNTDEINREINVIEKEKIEIIKETTKNIVDIEQKETNVLNESSATNEVIVKESERLTHQSAEQCTSDTNIKNISSEVIESETTSHEKHKPIDQIIKQDSNINAFKVNSTESETVHENQIISKSANSASIQENKSETSANLIETEKEELNEQFDDLSSESISYSDDGFESISNHDDKSEQKDSPTIVETLVCEKVDELNVINAKPSNSSPDAMVYDKTMETNSLPTENCLHETKETLDIALSTDKSSDILPDKSVESVEPLNTLPSDSPTHWKEPEQELSAPKLEIAEIATQENIETASLQSKVENAYIIQDVEKLDIPESQSESNKNDAEILTENKSDEIAVVSQFEPNVENDVIEPETNESIINQEKPIENKIHEFIDRSDASKRSKDEEAKMDLPTNACQSNSNDQNEIKTEISAIKSEESIQHQIIKEETFIEKESQIDLISEKRKADTIRPTEGSECKKICEERTILDDKRRDEGEISNLETNQEPMPNETVDRKNEIPPVNIISDSQLPSIDIQKSNDKMEDLTAMIVRRKELAAKNCANKTIKIWHEHNSNSSNEPASRSPVPSIEVTKSPDITAKSFFATIEPNKLAAPIAIANASELELLKQKLETDAKLEDEKLTLPKTEQSIETPTLSHTHQLRNLKRRLSGEKVRHSSESENDAIDAIGDLGTADYSSDDEVGGKRIKIRGKMALKNVRKTVEQKRNVKDADWSSDDNEKQIAKQSTTDLLRSRLRSKNVENETPKKIEILSEETTNSVSNELSVLELLTSDVKIKENEAIKVEEQQPIINETPEEKPEQEKEVEIKDDDDVIDTPVDPPKRAGRPPRKSAKKPAAKPKSSPKKTIEKMVTNAKNDDLNDQPDETKDESEPIIDEKPKPLTPPKPEPRKKKRSLLGLDVTDDAIIAVNTDGETPVRQSRRIAQIKIKEEAERRKAEEIALKKLKEASEKKKKGGATETVSETKSESEEEEEENSESEQKLEKKKKRKKGSKDKPWQTDSSDSSERDEEDVDDHEDVERLPPLRSDHEFSPESDIEDESQIVPTKRARTARKDKTDKRAKQEEETDDDDADVHACQNCSKNDHPEWILLCDKCDKGYHCSCLIPVLFVIPEGFWFCPSCQQEKLIDELELKLIEYDAAKKHMDLEEAKRQRILFTSINEANVLKESKREKQRERAERKIQKRNSSDDYSSSSDDEPNRSNDDNASNASSSNRSRKRSESSSNNSSDDEPIYKLRKRRQANVSYRFNEYDELINRAIKSEMDEVAGAGNLGRGKDISTIIEADKEEKRIKKMEHDQKVTTADDTLEKPIPSDGQLPDDKEKAHESNDSDSEPIRPKIINRNKQMNKKKKKLNSLDVDTDDDVDSDDDFKTSSYSDDDEEENYSGSSGESDSSLEMYRRRGKKGRMSTRRSVRDRKKRYDADFIDDNSDDDDKPLVKKKKKVDSDFSDFNDSSDDELEEDVDSDDLCDDSSDDGSDRAWQKSRKTAKKSKSISKPAASKPVQKKKIKRDDEEEFKGSGGKKKCVFGTDDEDDDDDDDEVLPKSRRTRGKKLPYLLEDDFDSSDDGIKPGVKRPDTPPEERAAFIQKQEEIKRMLAEKGAESGAIEPITKEKNKLDVPKDSLSTIPLQIIQSAKALDVDLKKSAIVHKNTAASDNDSNGFDDDLPEDFDPEDMDEDEIAKMMEEEDFAQQQLKLAGEAIRIRKLKDATIDCPKKDNIPIAKINVETAHASVIMPQNVPLGSPPVFSGSLTIPDIPPSMYSVQNPSANSKITTTPKKRGRKFKEDAVPLLDDNNKTMRNINLQLPPKDLLSAAAAGAIPMSTIQHTTSLSHPKHLPQMPLPSGHHGLPLQSLPIQHTPSVISHSSLLQQQQQQQQQRAMPSLQQSPSSSILGIARNQEPIIPTTVLEVQNTRLLDPSELGHPPSNLLESPAKKRGRRKKFTPLRDSVMPTGTAPTGLPPPIIPVDLPKPSILSERLAGNLDNKRGLSIAAPPQLYSPVTAGQPSVITRLTRPPHGAPFTGNPPPQRYYPTNHPLPSHSVASHSRPPYHTPNVVVTSGHRPSPLPNSPSATGHLPHSMFIRRGQPSIYGSGYPGIPPSPQMHRALQAMEAAGGSSQEYTGPYQNLPFGSYYPGPAPGPGPGPGPGPTPAHLSTSIERRTGAIIGSFEQYDNVNKNAPPPHDRTSASVYAHHHSSISVSTITPTSRHSVADVDDDRSVGSGGGSNGAQDANPNVSVGVTGSSSEFSGLVSYFSSQQDDLDS